MAVFVRGGLVVDCTLIGSWLGVDRLKTAKHGSCTACTALYRFGGGWRLGGRSTSSGKLVRLVTDRKEEAFLIGENSCAIGG
jgi:hypothetical protein